MKKIGVFVGRFSPLHLGHETVINHMVKECGAENCLLVLGSCNSSMTFRHLFSYEDRRGFIKEIYPDVKVVGLPDFPSNEEWLLALDDLLSLKGFSSDSVIFYGGCDEDVYFFIEAQKEICVLNRFNGDTPKVSATEVRDCLIQGRVLEGLVNPLLVNPISDRFKMRWEKFRKM